MAARCMRGYLKVCQQTYITENIVVHVPSITHKTKSPVIVLQEAGKGPEKLLIMSLLGGTALREDVGMMTVNKAWIPWAPPRCQVEHVCGW